jgi:glutamyl-tRNA reductase
LVLAPKSGVTQLQGVAEQAEALLVGRVPGIAGHLYRHAGSAGVRHLFRVAASLDSLVLGEPQILGQVKAAIELARSSGTLGPTLNRVAVQATRTAKRVRSETSVGVGQISVPSVAVDLAGQIFGDLRGKTSVLIGSGEMGETVARLLVQAGSKLIVVGRNLQRVEELAKAMQAQARGLSDLDQTLGDADVVIAATSAPGYVITRQSVAPAMRKRRGRSLFFVDLAVPRDIDPSIAELDNTFLYNIDDFSQIAGQAALLRQREAQAAEALVERDLAQFERSTSAEQVTPTVVALRRSFRAVLEAELERSQRGKLRHLPAADLEALQTLIDAAVNKLLHAPTQRLRQLASEEPTTSEIETYVEVLSELFALGDENSGVSRTSQAPPEPQANEQQSLTDVEPRRGVR